MKIIYDAWAHPGSGQQRRIVSGDYRLGDGESVIKGGFANVEEAREWLQSDTHHRHRADGGKQWTGTYWAVCPVCLPESANV